jgi:hypothetical protein
MHPHGHTLCAEDDALCLAPGDGLPGLRRHGLPHRLCRRERCGARLLGLAAPLRAGWGHEHGRADLVRQAAPEGAADTHDRGDVPGVEPQQEGRGVAVARVGDHRGERNPPRPRPIQQGERPLGLRLQGKGGRDPDLGPARTVSGPGLRPIELGGHGPMDGGAAGRLSRHVVRADDALTISDLAQRPSILAGDTHRASPLLGQSRVIEHQDALGRTLRPQRPHTLVVERLGGPERIGSQRLEPFSRGRRHRGGDGGAGLVRQVGQ